MSATSSNAWLRNQRKSDLLEIADKVGLKNHEAYKKSELEAALDDHLASGSSKFSTRPDLVGYYNSRSRSMGSPVKKELPSKEELEKPIKVTKRRVTKAVEDLAASESDDRRASTSSTALVRTPARSLSQVAARIPLPATPADVAMAVDRSTMIVRQRVNSIYKESGITDASHGARQALSTVTSVLFLVSAVELYFIRREVLPDRYAFTIPANHLLGTSDYPVALPDMFLLLTASFWSPALTWFVTSFLAPSFFGYFFNLNVNASSAAPRTRARTAANPDYVVDPLTFSIAKALISYVVYAQGATFGLFGDVAIERLNSGVYGGYKGILTGAAITGLVSIYDAVLRN